MERGTGLIERKGCSERRKSCSQSPEYSNYLNWYQTRENSANKQRMKITEAASLPFVKTGKYTQHKNDKDTAERIASDVGKLNVSEYLRDEDQEVLLRLIKQLVASILSARRADLIDEYSIKLTNITISKIKEHADRSTDTVSKPSSTGLSEYIENRTNLLGAVNHILETLLLPECNEKEYVGELEEKGKIFINNRYRFLCGVSYTKEFDSSIGINRLKDIVSALKCIKENIFADDMASKIDELNQKLQAFDITSIRPFLGISRFICDENGMEYTASNGEQGILLLQRALQKEADAYFLDEPELGMGGSYIDANIRPLIVNLAKQRKYVIVATHNANIAVRTLPYTSIFRTHENGKYLTYIGNPFNDMLVNIADEHDVRSWAEECLHTLEGGNEAFYERRDIYESKNN